jgi:guanosine-3',5'-bis(diphosphate) 3'-pyrophosphohydrolase
MPSFEDTIRFIQKAHEGQTDKQGEEYWKHPVHVAGIVASVFNGTEDEKIAALLHDVTEDTHYTLQDLREMGYSPATLEIVWWMDKANNRGTYLERMEYMAMKAPTGALKVKLADNMSNMREGVTPSLKKRYERSMAILKDALEQRG